MRASSTVGLSCRPGTSRAAREIGEASPVGTTILAPSDQPHQASAARAKRFDGAARQLVSGLRSRSGSVAVRARPCSGRVHDRAVELTRQHPLDEVFAYRITDASLVGVRFERHVRRRAKQ